MRKVEQDKSPPEERGLETPQGLTMLEHYSYDDYTSNL